MAEQEFKHIVRVVNTDLSGEKKIVDALRKIKGVSFMFANMACTLTGIDKFKKTGTLTDEEADRLTECISTAKGAPTWMFNRRKDYETGEDRHVVTGDIKFEQENDVKRMKMIKSYKGVRHMFNLPVRGQRTKSNFRKNKGNVLGVKKVKVNKKT